MHKTKHHNSTMESAFKINHKNNYIEKNQTSDTFYFLCFLINYDVTIYFGSVENLINSIISSTIHNMPTDLLILKFFEFCFWLKKTPNEIYNLIYSDSNTNNFETIDKLLELCAKKNTEFKIFNLDECANKVEKFMVQFFTKTENTPPDKKFDHIGYPLPDSWDGRPRLHWNVCRFPFCGKKFTHPNQLVNHLVQCNVYTQGFHHYHEQAVFQTNLTPEKVLNNNIKCCPSIACEHKEFDTPENLIKHLTILGIEPFWKKGMVITFENSIEKLNKIDQTKQIALKYPKIFINEQCVFCLDAKPEILVNKCGHHTYCLKCYDNGLDKRICPVCRGRVDYFIPFS